MVTNDTIAAVLAPLVDQVWILALTLIGGILLYAFRWAMKKVMDFAVQKHLASETVLNSIAERLDNAFVNGIHYATDLISDKVASKSISSTEVKTQILTEATKYVTSAMADSLKKLDINAEGVEARIRARISKGGFTDLIGDLENYAAKTEETPAQTSNTKPI